MSCERCNELAQDIIDAVGEYIEERSKEHRSLVGTALKYEQLTEAYDALSEHLD